MNQQQETDQLFAGVDLGGTSIKVALADCLGNRMLTRAIPTHSHRGAIDVVQRIGTLIGDLLNQSGKAPEQLHGIGVGAPGLVDVHEGVTKFLPNFPTHWRDVPVTAMLQEHFQVPVRLLNDVRSATLGELRFGHGCNHPRLTMAFFSIGTGIGGGLALQGKLWLGPLGAAGELGHQTIIPDGPRCGCGNRGCLEAIASGTAIAAEGVRLMRCGLAPSLHESIDGNADRVTVREMTAHADQDPPLKEALIEAAKSIGIAAANVVTILHPDMIVLGGGVAEMGPLLTDTVRQVIRERVGMMPTDNVRVERSLLGEHAGLQGAIALAMGPVELSGPIVEGTH
ncbi:ROK family protein [Neorhodopirellula pilleata]|uniref:Glucokinase n=1 Tax=Neorhodopirellula pilleata TaxID=2714738 RepID=A0A5C6A9S4_9BACT|nr:ROK family protein [Neorhodopirellula pilleata]TWT96309.1 Glucokinase [Neorhodopirellula pilleata]